MARPKKAEGEQAVPITVTARARDMIDEQLRHEWAGLLDRGVFTTMTPEHFIASQRRARVSQLIEARYGPEGMYPTKVEVNVPLPHHMSDAETRELEQWTEQMLTQMNETMPAAVRAAIAANEARLNARAPVPESEARVEQGPT